MDKIVIADAIRATEAGAIAAASVTRTISSASSFSI